VKYPLEGIFASRPSEIEPDTQLADGRITTDELLTPTETRFLAEALEITDLGSMGGDVDTESSSIHY
jgi:hypothetical protein